MSSYHDILKSNHPKILATFTAMKNRFQRFRSYSFLKKLRIVSLWLLGMVFLTIFMANWRINSNAEGKVFTSVETIPYHKVGLVLGTSKYNRRGNINAYYAFRIDAAVALYKAGKISFILVSGDNGSKEYDEPTAMKEDLIAAGVPANKIFLDYAGFRTLDSMERALKVFGQKDLTIISQEFHNERAIYLAESFGIEAVGFNARDVKKNRGFKTKIREYFARVKVFVDLWTGTDSKFLGEPVEIR